jgi:hypothetical protein
LIGGDDDALHHLHQGAAGMDDRDRGDELAAAALHGLADAIKQNPSLAGSVEPAIVNALLAVYHELRHNSALARNALVAIDDPENLQRKATERLASAVIDHSRMLGFLQTDIVELRKAIEHNGLH